MKDITPHIWQYFREICSIPRPSKKEEKICAYIRQFAARHKLVFKQDGAGNIVVHKPASAGKEHCPALILQSHVDMVCEKNSDVRHNFNTDPIDFYIDGDWMKARGTTLGADDGIGVAATLAILADPDIVHGPVEALFTVDEETALTGAKALQKDFLAGNILINLDSEDEGELFIGCAGGIDTVATFTYRDTGVPPDSIAYRISISGMTGGHSGDDIDKKRGNAVKILGRILLDASDMFGLSVSTFDGGNLRNAIPREASATVSVHSLHQKDFEDYCVSQFQRWKKALMPTSPEFLPACEPCPVPASVIDAATLLCLLNALAMCPSDAVEWSETMPGLVSTSSNLASVKFTGKHKIVVATSQRSDREEAKKHLSGRVRDIFEKAGAKVTHANAYPGWTPNPQSAILNITKSAYQELFHKEPVVRAIHAGLECGLFLEKFPHLDMISFGPTIRNVHSPSEQLNIPAVKLFAGLLLGVINKISENK